MTKHRGHGEGTAPVKRSDGRWAAAVSLPGGKRKWYYGKTKTEVKEKLQAAMAARYEGRLSADRSQKVAEYLAGWLETKRPGIKPRTAENYDLNVERLVEHLGSIRLDALAPAHIQQCYTDLSRRLSPYSVRQAHRVLHSALDQAVLWNLVPRNAVDAVIAPRPPRDEMTILTLEQLMTLFEGTRDDRFHSLWVLLGTTGLRIAEALGLKWSDIDWDRKRLVVRRTAQRQQQNGLVFVDTKTTGSRRTVELPDEAIQVLRDQQTRQLWTKRKSGETWLDNDLVFSTKYGKPLDRGRIFVNFKSALKKAGLPDMRVHDLRHTAASIMLHELQLPVKLVSEMLGHTNITTTLATYGHLMPTMHRDAADRIDALFARSRSAER